MKWCVLPTLAIVCSVAMSFSSCSVASFDHQPFIGEWEHLSPDSISGTHLTLRPDSSYHMEAWHFDVITPRSGRYLFIVPPNRAKSKILLLIPDAELESQAPDTAYGAIQALDIVGHSSDSWRVRLPSGDTRFYNRRAP